MAPASKRVGGLFGVSREFAPTRGRERPRGALLNRRHAKAWKCRALRRYRRVHRNNGRGENPKARGPSRAGSRACRDTPRGVFAHPRGFGSCFLHVARARSPRAAAARSARPTERSTPLARKTTGLGRFGGAQACVLTYCVISERAQGCVLRAAFEQPRGWRCR
jgi:hypothetical protein